MPGDAATITYSLREPFERAVESVRKALANRGLKVVGQLDVSKRVERAVGIALPPCRIIFVLPEPSALKTANLHRCAAIFLPIHIVISGGHARTEIQVQNRVCSSAGEPVPAFAAPVMETQAQISEVIEAIAMRPSLVV
jgi:uncharacterized protein (DUF302 family)